MPVMTVCASHSPLMFTGIEESTPGLQRGFLDCIDGVAARVRDFDPELVVLFAPDHFNALYYDLMPSFCVVANATTSTDWQQESGRLRISREQALALVRSLQSEGFDPAISMRMRVDHGMTIALRQIAGGYQRFPLLPVYVNCAADPRPPIRRAREFGAAVGRFAARQAERILLIGSGGLSHDPPTPRLAGADAEAERRLVERHEATPDVFKARERRVVDVARRLAAGERPILPPSESWDRRCIDAIVRGDLESFDAMTDEAIDREGGFGGHEIRCWLAAFAAARVIGPAKPQLDYYAVVPEWITGMGVMSAAQQ